MKTITFHREQLYKEVWETPVSKLSSNKIQIKRTCFIATETRKCTDLLVFFRVSVALIHSLYSSVYLLNPWISFQRIRYSYLVVIVKRSAFDDRTFAGSKVDGLRI